MQLSVKIKIPPELNRFLKNPSPIYKKYFDIAVGKSFKRVKQVMSQNPKTPKKTGEMIRSYRENVREREMVSTLPRAGAHETGAYIRPKRGKFLHWVEGGKDVFAKAVRIKPKRYVSSSINRSRKDVIEIFSKTFRDMLERV